MLDDSLLDKRVPSESVPGESVVANWWNHPIVQTVLAIAVVGAIALVGWKIILRLRGATNKPDTSDLDLVRNFEEMRRGGDISDQELRTIKGVLGKTRSRGGDD